MRIHFEPGSRYAYSGEGIILLQFVLENGPGLRVGDEMQRRVFDRFGMTRTSMMWRDDFAGNLADGYKSDGSFEPHDKRSRPRAAGSMDTTIADFARFLAAFSRGDGLSARARAEMIRPQIGIRTPSQFPTLLEAVSPAMTAIKLSAGLGVVTFEGHSATRFSRRPQRLDRQPGHLCREEPPVRRLPVERCSRRARLPAPHRGDAWRSRDAVVMGGLYAVRQPGHGRTIAGAQVPTIL
jgi:CubicO group peptidase (beta-lactamase class C family)